ncbi:MAG: hypothetical protein PHV91_08430 [Bacteroidales bacterium]|nr:hypothetical protein [Bacteroidales bacterium]
MYEKKVFFIAFALLIAGAAIKAYAEDGVFGKCDGATENGCFATCPNCDSLFEGLSGTGNGTLTRGICPACGYEIGIDN